MQMEGCIKLTTVSSLRQQRLWLVEVEVLGWIWIGGLSNFLFDQVTATAHSPLA